MNDYRAAVEEAKRVTEIRTEAFERNRAAYDRYYDAVSKIGERAAAEFMPEDAATVRELEGASIQIQEARDRIATAFTATLVAKAAELAEASLTAEGSPVARLRADMMALDAFRKAEVDGRVGKMWNLLTLGHGVDRKERDRLLNKVLATWCAVHDVSPLDMTLGARPFYNVPDPAEYGSSDTEQLRWAYERHGQAFLQECDGYPFDLKQVLEEARSWDECDPDFVDFVMGQLPSAEIGPRH